MTMASNSIDIGNADALKTTFNSIFQQLGVQVDTAFQEAMDEVGKEAVRRLRADSPKGHGSKRGHYATGWTYKKANVRKGMFSAKVYNKNKPGLAHLLEFGHEKIDRNGDSHGVKSGNVHIQPVNDWVQSELPRRISQKMK